MNVIGRDVIVQLNNDFAQTWIKHLYICRHNV